MLEFGALFLKLVVVVLQHLDQLLKIVDFLFVVQLDLVELYAVVVWHVCHLSQSAVFSDKVLDLVGQVVDFVEQVVNFLVLGVFLGSENIDAFHRVASVNISGVESEVFVEPVDFVKELLLFVLKLPVVVVGHSNVVFEALVVRSESNQLFPLVFQGDVHFLLNNVLDTVYIVLCVVETCFVVVAGLNKMSCVQVIVLAQILSA